MKNALFDLLPIVSKRMNYDEFLVRCLAYENMHQHSSSGIYSRTNNKQEMDNLYDNILLENEDELKKITKRVESKFKFMKNILSPLSLKERKLIASKFSQVLTLFVFTYAIEEKYGKNFKIEDYTQFAKTIVDAFVYLEDIKQCEVSARHKTRFKELQSLYTPSEIAERNMLLMNCVEKMGVEIISKDKERTFSVSEIYSKWREQNELCAYTKEKLCFSNAVGGHIKPHSKGYSTTYDNLVVLSKDANTLLSDQDLTEIVSDFNEWLRK